MAIAMGRQIMAADRPPRPASLIGPTAVVVLVAGYAALWLLARPAGQPTGRYLGEMAGMLALLLLSLALVTSSGLMGVLEVAFATATWPTVLLTCPRHVIGARKLTQADQATDTYDMVPPAVGGEDESVALRDKAAGSSEAPGS